MRKNDIKQLKVEGIGIKEQRMNRIATENFCKFLKRSIHKDISLSPIDQSQIIILEPLKNMININDVINYKTNTSLNESIDNFKI